LIEKADGSVKVRDNIAYDQTRSQECLVATKALLSLAWASTMRPSDSIPIIPRSGATKALFSKLLERPPRQMLAFAKAKELRGYNERLSEKYMTSF